MKKQRDNQKRPLKLGSETIRQLDNLELKVVGGGNWEPNCSGLWHRGSCPP